MPLKPISVASISLSKGGGALRGMGETFQPNAFTGTSSFSIPIPTSSCRGFEPQLSIDYSSGTGNGIFGIGFTLAVPNISRKTEKGFPKYDDADIFLISNADELAPKLVEKNGKWEKGISYHTSNEKKNYLITQYRPRTEGLFARIEKWVNTDDRSIHWEVTTKDNVISIYGKNENARIADPKNPTHIFQWLLEETQDAKGNRISYEYQSDDLLYQQNDLGEGQQSEWANKYIHKIKYGNYVDKRKEEKWHFELIFDYGEREPDQLGQIAYETKGTWKLRKDPFSAYRAGFEIRTQRLCKRILMFHRFGDKEPFLVHGTHFKYKETSHISFLSQVAPIGYRTDNGIFQRMAAPSLDLKYSEPLSGSGFQLLTSSSVNGGSKRALNQRIDQMVDLYGEGLPGILYNDDQTVLYSRPLGNGCYALPKVPSQFPIYRNLESAEISLFDLGGDGKLDLVVQTPSNSGYFQSNTDETWDAYRPFPGQPADLFSDGRQMLDVTGDGLADLVLFEARKVKIYPSKGKRGFSASTEKMVEYELPFSRLRSAVEHIGFADIFGDGGNHLVRIRNGSVECWPHLGYGRFGQKRVLAKAPRFGDQFDPSRLFLADIDGSGAADLIYACRDYLEIYRNQSGNSFGEKEIMPLPSSYDQLDQIRFADVIGNGADCLILSSRDKHMQFHHEFYDFNGGLKPHLLIGINNNMGAEKKINYRPSTKFYLDDLKAGKPWATRLSFPVQVLESVEVIDHITGSKLVTRYAYHDGYFDPIERKFRGFGYVEQWDAESFEDHKQWMVDDKKHRSIGTASAMDENPDNYVAPVYTRSWFHTGSSLKSRQFSKHYQNFYYDGDSESSHLPDSFLDEVSFKGAPPETIEEACRALYGHKLREEIYAWNNEQPQDPIGDPFTVTESNYKIRLVQPLKDQKHAVCFVHPSEEISWHYECNPEDPRVEHSFILEVDSYGQVRKSCHVYYPRRKAKAPEQQQLRALATIHEFINKPNEDGFYLLGVLSEAKTFELGGLQLEDNDRFAAAQIREYLNLALDHEIPFEQACAGVEPQARLLSWQRHFYWNDEVKEELPFNEVAGHMLPHHTENVVFSKKQLTEVFGEKLEPTIYFGKEEENGKQHGAGYVHKDNYYWNPGLTQHYLNSDDFYLPSKTVDPFGAETAVAYDGYKLVPIFIADALGNETVAEVDYHTLQPFRITDINDNKSEVLFDPLGRVIVTSIYGKENGKAKGDEPIWVENSERKPKGDANFNLADILKAPEDYLLQATSYFFYELGYVNNQPPHSVSLMRETHVHDLKEKEQTKIQIHIAYSDGFGRALQTKIKASMPDKEGQLNERWLTSGRTVYNNKGKPVKQYEPFYNSKPDYESNPAVTEHGVTHITHYDPLLRVVRVTNPDGYYSKVEFTPWEEKHYDENDTFPDSPFYDTPETHRLDTQGHVFQVIRQLESGEELLTKHKLDIQGNKLSSTDPRGICCFEHKYDMTGAVLWTKSADAGERWTLHNVLGKPLHVWDSRNFRISTRYDALHRPVEIYVKGDDVKGLVLDNVVERMRYGGADKEAREEEKKQNLCGQLLEHYDQAGIVEFGAYDVKGALLQSTRRLRKNYKEEPDWSANSDKVIEGEEIQSNIKVIRGEEINTEPFVLEWQHDALGRVIQETQADGTISKPSYHPEGWLKRLDVTPGTGLEEDPTAFVKNIKYNAKGQRTQITYGNDVTTSYDYNSNTFRLTRLHSYLTNGGSSKKSLNDLQDIHYEYDPVGNITEIQDDAQQTHYFDGQVVHPNATYRYDAIYRLIEASGREHIGQAGKPHHTGWNDKYRTHRPQPGNGKAMRNYTEIYKYDESGNMKTISHEAKNGGWTRKFVCEKTNNRLKHTYVGNATATDYNYDDHGNIINMPHLPLMRWDYRDQLLATARQVVAEGETPETTWYVYDAHGQRVRQITESYAAKGDTPVCRKERIYIGGSEIYREYKGKDDAASLERKTLHVMDGKKRIALVEYKTKENEEEIKKFHPIIRYQLGNHLGSASLELDTAGKIISYEEYYPYGSTSYQAVNSQIQVSQKRYRYSGKERDDSTGLYYYGFRYYATWLCRWISPDPAGTVDGLNLYAFVRGNPVLLLDHHGLVGQAAPKLLSKFINHATKRYLRNIVAGSGLTMAAESLSKGLESTSFTPPSSDVFQKYSSKITKGANEDPMLLGSRSAISGFDPRTWEMPRPSPRLQELGKYAWHSTPETLQEDTRQLGMNILWHEAAKVRNTPSKALEATKRTGSIIYGISSGDNQVLIDNAHQRMQHNATKSAQQIGINLILKAPTQLVPGLPGLLIRSFINVKIAGNFGRAWNHMAKEADKLKGPIIDTIKDRNRKNTK